MQVLPVSLLILYGNCMGCLMAPVDVMVSTKTLQQSEAQTQKVTTESGDEWRPVHVIVHTDTLKQNEVQTQKVTMQAGDEWRPVDVYVSTDVLKRTEVQTQKVATQSGDEWRSDNVILQEAKNNQIMESVGESHNLMRDQLQRTADDVTNLQERTDDLYDEIDSLQANITQGLKETSTNLEFKVHSLVRELSAVRQEIAELKRSQKKLNATENRTTQDPAKSHKTLKTDDIHSSNIQTLVQKVDAIEENWSQMSSELKITRGQNWALQRTYKAIERRQYQIQKDIKMLRGISLDNMAIISNQFLHVQEHVEQSLNNLNKAINKRIDKINVELAKEIVQVGIQTLTNYAETLIEKGWYPTVHQGLN